MAPQNVLVMIDGRRTNQMTFPDGLGAGKHQLDRAHRDVPARKRSLRGQRIGGVIKPHNKKGAVRNPR